MDLKRKTNDQESKPGFLLHEAIWLQMANINPQPCGKEWDTSSSHCSPDTQPTGSGMPRPGRILSPSYAHTHRLLTLPPPHQHLPSPVDLCVLTTGWLWTKALELESSSEPRQAGCHVRGRAESSLLFSGSCGAWQPWFLNQKLSPTISQTIGWTI